MKAVIFGFEGFVLTASERDFFRDADPAGYILFKRNCDTADQLRALTDSLRDICGREVGSSRVDLQACKLEYSIVSPK